MSQFTETVPEVSTEPEARAEPKPDLDRMDDKVYVNSFLTKLSEGMTVKNNITREYLDYIAAMDPSLYGAIQYGYGMSLNELAYLVWEHPNTEESVCQIAAIIAFDELKA